jgi:hypothetical protein
MWHFFNLNSFTDLSSVAFKSKKSSMLFCKETLLLYIIDVCTTSNIAVRKYKNGILTDSVAEPVPAPLPLPASAPRTDS